MINKYSNGLKDKTMCDKDTYQDDKLQDQPKYKIRRFVISLVFLALSIVALGVGIGALNALMPTDVEIDNGIAAFGVMLLMYMWIFVMAVSFVFVFLFSLGGFLCGIFSLKSLPNRTMRISAIVSTVLNGIIMSISLVASVILVGLIFRVGF